jgi:hypothetical protein
VTLDPALLAEMLEEEIAVARAALETRVTRFEILGPYVLCHLPDVGENVILRLDATNYDAEPCKVAMVDDHGDTLAPAEWPGKLFHSIHPVLHRGFVCIRGTYEYHCHPSHFEDRWATYRTDLRLPRLLDHLVRKAEP